MRKRFLRSFIALLLLFACLSATAFAETAVVTGSEVNVRSGPGDTYPILGSYARDSIVEVTDSSGSWYAVLYDGQIGYMAAQYLSLQADSQSATIVGSGPGQAAIQVPGQAVIVDPYEPGIVVTTPAPAATQAPTLADGSNAGASTGSTQQPTLATGQNVSGGTASVSAPSDAYVTPASSPAPAASASSQGQINAMYVRFRSGPSSDTAIIAEYNRGKTVTILGTQGEWTCCSIDGQTGYIFSQYVTVTNTASAPTLATGDAGIRVDLPTPSATPTPALSAPTLATADQAQGQAPAQAPAAGAQGDGTIVGDHVRFRSGPSTDYSILGTYDRGKTLTVLGTQGEWTYCRIDGKDGYVFSQYIQKTTGTNTGASAPAASPLPSPSLAVGDLPTATGTGSTGATAGYIKGNNVRFRAAPDSSSQILAELFFGNAVTITGSSGSWTAIVYEGQAGFVFSDYVAVGVYQQPTASGGTASGREIADFALGYVGYPYTWGGKDPSTGFDCSGFMYYVFKHFGYTLNRVSSEQAKNGRPIDPSELQPGDLLCFYSGSNYIGHVGLYIGNNRFVHAGTSLTGVIISELDGYYVSRGYEARRIVG